MLYNYLPNLKLWSSLMIIFILFFSELQASTGTQTIRGRLIDQTSKYPLAGASVAVLQDSLLIHGAVSDLNGYFRIEGVKFGRHTIVARYMGYETVFLNNIIVSSGRETILDIELTEAAFQLEGVVIEAFDQFESVNEMSIISTRNFLAEETERYAGSRQDPARMASNFAGVQGNDDSRNDIIVRGNSPVGLLWRYENINIPNPNHFAIVGSGGGPISVLNNKVIARSDFMTGAFPAGYGNALSGVFDVRMRPGNNEQFEFTGQFGLFGTELLAEGPISKEKRSSYLVAYRYSTLKIFESVNFNLGTTAVPNYQDLSFKLNFPTSKGAFSIFGLGGKSAIDIVVSDFNEPQDELYGRKDRDQYFRTDIGVLGTTLEHHHNENAYSRVTLAISATDINSNHDKVIRNQDFSIDTIYRKLEYQYIETKTSLSYSLILKKDARNTLQIGVYSDFYHYNFSDSQYFSQTDSWLVRLDYIGSDNALLLQPYLQWKHLLNPKLSFTAGIHLQHFLLNNSFAIEPRTGIRYQINNSHALSAGYGLHSQIQSSHVYLHHKYDDDGNKILHNKDIGFTKAHHIVTAYDYTINRNLRFKAEVYYQSLFNVPVEANKSSSFSLLNAGSGYRNFYPDSLVNEGTGENYGIELTLEKIFSKYYFFLTTFSLYESKYTGSDGIKRNTDFNGNFALNFLIGAELPVGKGKNKFLTLGSGLSWAGGKRYSPVDTAASNLENDIVWVDTERNSLQFDDYFRLDLRLGYKINARRVTHEFVIDIVNALNNTNILTISYDPDIAVTQPDVVPLRLEPQLGMLPVFFYKIDF